MHKCKSVVCSALLSIALSGISVAYAEGEQAAEASAPQAQTPAVQTPESQNSLSRSPGEAAPAEEQKNPADPYDVRTFFADFKRYNIGDVVPDLYRSKKYEITQWKVRHLPAPQEGSHWTYMGGNYVLIGNDDGKILLAKAGEIYYQH